MKASMKLSLMGLSAFSFVSFAVYANGNGAVSKAKTEDRQVKSSNQSRIAVAIGKFGNKSNTPDEIVNGIRTRIQQCVIGTMKFEAVDRVSLKNVWCVMKKMNRRIS